MIQRGKISNKLYSNSTSAWRKWSWHNVQDEKMLTHARNCSNLCRYCKGIGIECSCLTSYACTPVSDWDVRDRVVSVHYRGAQKSRLSSSWRPCSLAAIFQMNMIYSVSHSFWKRLEQTCVAGCTSQHQHAWSLTGLLVFLKLRNDLSELSEGTLLPL